MGKIMQKMHYRFQIMRSEIFGFDSVSSNSKTGELLEDHPGFRIMVQKVNTEPVDLEWWMGCEPADLFANRKGLLWKHIECTDVSHMTNAQLVDRFRKWAPVVKESEELTKLNVMLSGQNAALIDRVRELEEEVRAERAFSHDLLMKHVSSVTERHDRAFGRGNAAD
jgi:hypothetical protein